MDGQADGRKEESCRFESFSHPPKREKERSGEEEQVLKESKTHCVTRKTICHMARRERKKEQFFQSL